MQFIVKAFTANTTKELGICQYLYAPYLSHATVFLIFFINLKAVRFFIDAITATISRDLKY